MKPVIAVIGAGYGDEGKGLMADFFARRFSIKGIAPLVARGNGGAQAGHTVVTDIHRHVFGHVGAGTFANSDTYLSSNFIVNPSLLKAELSKIGEMAGARVPFVYASRDCRVTTIYDMAINSLVELKRGLDRHGSCGMGINETVTRHNAGYQIKLSDLWAAKYPQSRDAHRLQVKLEAIRDKWAPARMKELGIHENTFNNESGSVKASAEIYLSMFLMDAEELTTMMAHAATDIHQNQPIKSQAQEIIYEGAQGLMLDEFLGEFPHVTRSVTGLPSAVRAAHELGRTEVTPYYVMRCYATRHGAGHLEFEGRPFTSTMLNDTTNVPNPWQGTLRYAMLNLRDIDRYIAEDLIRGDVVGQAFGITIENPKIVVTCLDQIGDTIKIAGSTGIVHDVVKEEVPQFIYRELGYPVEFVSTGPTASDVRESGIRL